MIKHGIQFGAALAMALGFSVLAQTPEVKPEVKAPTKPLRSPAPPVIPVEVREQFFKSQAQLQAAQRTAEQAQKDAQTKQEAFQGLIKQAQDACGADYQLGLDPSPDPKKNGDLICTEKPKPAEPVKK